MATATADDGGGDDDGGDDNIEPGDASTEQMSPAPGGLRSAVRQMAQQMQQMTDAVNGLTPIVHRVQASQEGLQVVVTNLSKSVKTIASLTARQEKLEAELKVLQGRMPDTAQLRQDLLPDIQLAVEAALAADRLQRTAPTPPTQAPVSPAATIQSEPVVAVTSPEPPLTRADLAALVQELTALRQPPAQQPIVPGQPVPDTINQAPSSTARSAGSIFLDNVNPLSGIKDVAMGLFGLMTLPADANSIVARDQNGMTLEQRGQWNAATQMLVRGGKVVIPWVAGTVAGVSAYKTVGGVAVLGGLGNTTLLSVSGGSVLAALSVGAAAFAAAIAVLAGLSAMQADNMLALKEAAFKRELLLQAHQKELLNAIASMTQPSVSQPRAS